MWNSWIRIPTDFYLNGVKTCFSFLLYIYVCVCRSRQGGSPGAYDRSFRWKYHQFRFLCHVSNWSLQLQTFLSPHTSPSLCCWTWGLVAQVLQKHISTCIQQCTWICLLRVWAKTQCCCFRRRFLRGEFWFKTYVQAEFSSTVSVKYLYNTCILKRAFSHSKLNCFYVNLKVR